MSSFSILVPALAKAKVYLADQPGNYSIEHLQGNATQVDGMDTFFIDALAGHITMILPDPTLVPAVFSKGESATIRFKRVDLGPADVKLTGAPGVSIDGGLEVALLTNEFATLQTDGTSWWKV